jgi:hypothetical protein
MPRSFLFYLAGLSCLWSMGGDSCAEKLRIEARATAELIRQDSYGDSDRGLEDYKQYFDLNNGGFSSKLSMIQKEGGTWIDGGARASLPQRQFLKAATGSLHPETKAIAISQEISPSLEKELRHEATQHAGAFSSHVEDLSQENSLSAKGPFELVTDFLGAFSYAHHPTKVLDNYIANMKDDASLYVATRNDRSFVVEGNKKIPLMEWLADNYQGLEFTKLHEKLGIYKIGILDRSKLKPSKELILQGWNSALPPERTYSTFYIASDDEL